MKVLLILVIALCLVMTGCAMLEKIAPAQFDEEGNPIPGTHELTEAGQAVTANLGVWGSAAGAIPLLIWNFIELVKAKKDQKGLIATVQALKQAGEDPKTKEAFSQIKTYLSNAHEVAGVKLSINGLLAKL